MSFKLFFIEVLDRIAHKYTHILSLSRKKVQSVNYIKLNLLINCWLAPLFLEKLM
jgi:hypothetical protein